MTVTTSKNVVLYDCCLPIKETTAQTTILRVLHDYLGMSKIGAKNKLSAVAKLFCNSIMRIRKKF